MGPIVVQRSGAENTDSRKASLRDSGFIPCLVLVIMPTKGSFSGGGGVVRKDPKKWKDRIYIFSGFYPILGWCFFISYVFFLMLNHSMKGLRVNKGKVILSCQR